MTKLSREMRNYTSWSGLALLTILLWSCDSKFPSASSDPAGSVSFSIVMGDNQSGIAGKRLPSDFVVKVGVAEGAGYSTTPVTFEITSGSGTLTAPHTTTDRNGVARCALICAANPGDVVVRSTAPGYPPLTFRARVFHDISLELEARDPNFVRLVWRHTPDTGFYGYGLFRKAEWDIFGKGDTIAMLSRPEDTIYVDSTMKGPDPLVYQVEAVYRESRTVSSNTLMVFSDFQLPLDAPAADFILDTLHSRVYVSLPQSKEIAVVDVPSLSMTGRLSLGSTPGRLALNRNSSLLYVALTDVGGVALVSLPYMGVIRTMSLAAILDDVATYDMIEYLPGHLLVNAEDWWNSTAYLALVRTDQQDRATRPVPTSFPGYTPAMTASPDRRTIYMTRAQGAIKIDALTLITDSTFALRSTQFPQNRWGVTTQQAAMSPDGRRLYVAEGLVVDAQTLELVAELPATGIPVLNGDGSLCCWSRGVDEGAPNGAVKIFDTQSLTIADSFEVSFAIRRTMFLPGDRSLLFLSGDTLRTLKVR